VRTAVGAGAFAASRVSALAINPGEGETHTVIARDEESGELLEIRARAIVNATGVWTEESQAMLREPAGLGVTMSKGVHIVVDRDRFRSELGLILRAGASVLFVIPWGDHWLIGTTDTPWHFDKTNPAATSSDVDYLLQQVNGVLEHPIARADIRAVWAGLRPLVKGKARSTAKLSREHVVDVPRAGIAVVAGGKLTTYRVMARDAVDAALTGRVRAPRSSTQRTPLVGARGLDAARGTSAELAAEYGLAPLVTERLLGRYGDRLAEVLEPIAADPSLANLIAGGGGAILAEALYAVTHEGALHLEDVLERRLRIAMESSDSAMTAAPEVAELMAASLGWDTATVRAELASHRQSATQRDAATELPDDASANAVLTSDHPSRFAGVTRTW
jgi:glycerol-3-phosphate dehydrogenase